ncbi:MAG: hypothetical protein EON52_21040 [Actinomycetales bacterium]|nr:MAG: hypothetical protein EON52_21040 [Actinomycetales bacterium]
MQVVTLVERSARMIRLSVIVAILAVLPMLVALRAFDAAHVQTFDAVVDRSCVGACHAESPEVATEQARLEKTGLVCSSTPTLTDHVVVEDTEGTVSTLSFDAALRRSSAGDVWVRRYCSAP